ncbi:protein PIH1D3 [Phthorimaea operculella]|nr:protein PIH1D3 [Phthorimaea operculella]
MDFGPSTMQQLAELLRPPEPDVIQGDDLASSPYEITSTRDKLPAPIQEEKKGPKNIEEYEEQEAKEAEEASKIGPKTPGSASCEHLIVRIKMPGDKKENVDLAVDTNSVTVGSSQYHLQLPLPHGIDPDRSKASWDSSTDTLILTLQLDREFDFVNF